MPFAFVVRATTTVGRPFSPSAVLTASRTASISFPSTAATCSTERCELVGNRLHVHDLSGRPGDLQIVDIDESDEVVESVVARNRRAFPVRPFGELTIPKDGDNPSSVGRCAKAKCHPCGNR